MDDSSLSMEAGPFHALHTTNSHDLTRSVRFNDQVKVISYESDARMRKHIWYRVSAYAIDAIFGQRS